MFDIRHNQQVRLISIPEQYTPTNSPIRIGQTGKVLAMIKKDNKAEYLIKWNGKSGPVAVWRHEIAPI